MVAINAILALAVAIAAVDAKKCSPKKSATSVVPVVPVASYGVSSPAPIATSTTSAKPVITPDIDDFYSVPAPRSTSTVVALPTTTAPYVVPGSSSAAAGPTPTATPSGCYGAIPKPEHIENKYASEIPKEIKDAKPAEVVYGAAPAAEVKPVNEPIKQTCNTTVTHSYAYGSKIILINANNSNTTTLLTATVQVSCAKAEADGSNLYELQACFLAALAHYKQPAQVKNVTLRADDADGTVTKIADADVAKPYYFVRNPSGQIAGAYVHPDETAEATTLKNGICETFTTNFAYADGKAQVAETGVASSRVVDYAAVALEHLVAIEAKYDDKSIVSYAPGSESNGPSSYKAHTNCVVDRRTGVIHTSYDRTEVESAQDLDGDGKPDMKVYASSDVVLKAEIPRVPSYGEPASKTLTPIQVHVSAKQRRGISGAEEAATLLARAAAADASAADRLVALAARDADAAAHVLNLARRQRFASNRPSRLHKRSGAESLDGVLLSALAASGLEDAHLHLAELAVDDANVHASMALSLATRPTRNVVAAVAPHASATDRPVLLLTLGSLLSHQDREVAATTIAPHVAPLRNATLDASTEQVILAAIGNMGTNAIVAADALLTVAADTSRPATVRSAALRAMAPVAHVPLIADRLAALTAAPTLHRRNIFNDFKALASAAIPQDWKPVISRTWDATTSPVFDAISPLPDRRADVASYPVHAAGLVGINAGFDSLRLTAAGGVFAGYTAQGCLVPDFKLHASARATAVAFGKRHDLLDARAAATKSSRTGFAGDIRVGFNGKTVFAQPLAFDCRSLNRPVANLRTELSRWTYDLPIYISTIHVALTASASLTADISARVCAAPGADATFRPSVRVGVTGSGATTVWFVRGRLDVDAEVGYTLAPAVTALDPREGCKVCARMRDAWDDSRVSVRANVEQKLSGDWKPAKAWDLVKKAQPKRGEEVVNGLEYCVDPKDVIAKIKNRA
ncbi:hypothetical protein HDU96_007686 [Phlyctochytrium bullatum]|nr:hypothetical protein HDU96_007686 [Phlyctochytrium bullatum]